jgi:hypothetical protein
MMTNQNGKIKVGCLWLTPEQLAERNRKVAQNAAKKAMQDNPEAYANRMRKMAKRGFQVQVERKMTDHGLGYDEAKRQVIEGAIKARREQLRNSPSRPQLACRTWLESIGWTFGDNGSSVEEYQPTEGRFLTIDFVNHETKTAVEVTSYRSDWINAAGRSKALEAKQRIMEERGYIFINIRMSETTIRRLLGE